MATLQDGASFCCCVYVLCILKWSEKLCFLKASDTPGDFIRRFAANSIASKNRRRFSPPIDANTLGDFFRRSRRCNSFEKSCDEIAQPDGLALLAIRSNDCRKSWARAHLANAGEFNGRYLTCQISAIFIRRSRRSAYQIAKCVAGLTKVPTNSKVFLRGL